MFGKLFAAAALLTIAAPAMAQPYAVVEHPRPIAPPVQTSSVMVHSAGLPAPVAPAPVAPAPVAAAPVVVATPQGVPVQAAPVVLASPPQPTWYYYYYQQPYMIQYYAPVYGHAYAAPAYYGPAAGYVAPGMFAGPTGPLVNARGELGHVRYPYHSYRRPWYYPGQPSFNVTIPGPVW